MSEFLNNRAKRKEALKEILRRLHAGEPVEEVKRAFADLLRDVGATEIAELEQELIAEGISEEEIKRLCDVHVLLFRESLDAQEAPRVEQHHPVERFRAENRAVERLLEALSAALAQLRDGVGADRLAAAQEALRRLRTYERHYSRKENLLFPYLERHGFSGPSSVMWAIHDDVRAGWKKLDALLRAGPGEDVEGFLKQVEELFRELDQTIREMVYKEERILFPTALDLLSDEEWEAIRAQESEIGFVEGVEPADFEAVAGQVEEEPGAEEVVREAGLISLDVGALTVEQINLMLTHLPVDVTFVDEHDEVRYFSKTRERIFTRTPAIIGRKVQKCHPPASVHRVQRILDDFRAGRRDVAEFWIQMNGRFIHIRYFALRDAEGRYRGTIEVSQDVTEIRALEGEKRLLDD